MSKVNLRRSALKLLATPFALSVPLTSAFAQDKKTVRLLVGFPAASISDIVARLIAPHIGTALGRNAIVEVKAGADGQIAAQDLIRQPPDGSSLFVATNSPLQAVPAMRQPPPYDPVTDFSHIGYSILGSGDFQCVVEGNQMMRVKHGFTSSDALHAVELAQRGTTGTRNIFLGPRGLLETHFHKKNDPTALTRGLGDIWEWPESMTKGYACCYGAHASMTGVEQLMKQHQFSYRDISRIRCGLHPTPFGLVADNYEKNGTLRPLLKRHLDCLTVLQRSPCINDCWPMNFRPMR